MRHFPPVLLSFLLAAAPAARSSPVFINEIHYDNVGTDADEGVEIAGPAGTPLGDYDLVLVNGTGGAPYLTLTLSGVLPDEGGGFGALWIAVPGIQNGAPDGMVLVRRAGAVVVQALAYEGAMTVASGSLAGLALPDIGVSQTGTEAAGLTLQLTGTGSAAADFAWSGPRAASRGRLNAGQTLTGTPAMTAAAQFVPSQVREGGGGTLHLTLTPAPGVPVTYALSAEPPDVLPLPASVTVPADGRAAVPFAVPVDGVPDGYAEVRLLLTDAAGQRPPAGAVLGVIDADRPPGAPDGAVRVMAFNVQLGTGTPGSDPFAAVREIVERVGPDIILFQEVQSAGDFGDLRAMLTAAGFPATPETLALKGDAFAADPLVRGDLSGNQDASLVVASRWPVTRRVQIGRGLSGRREVTRYPMLAAVDVPWLPAEQDPVVVSVHLKAETGEADAFRRGLELRRLREGLVAEGIDPAVRPVVVGGDFNQTDWAPQPDSFLTTAPPVQQPGVPFADGSVLPASFLLGTDLAAAPGVLLPYRVFPHSGMNPSGLTALDLRQADGVTAVTWPLGGAKLDYVFTAGAAGTPRGEIINSRIDSTADGLPKQPRPAAPGLSALASDHFAIFADIPLVPRPALVLTFNREWIAEGAAGLTATVSVSGAAAEARAFQIRAWRDGRLTFPDPIVLPAGATSVTVPVAVPAWPGVQPHRAVTAEATGGGWWPGTAAVEVRNAEASGQLVITQYAEPPASGGSRALELVNVSGQPIDFALQPLRIRRFANGGTEGLTDARADSGVLPPGGVLVIGEAAVGTWLAGQGLLPSGNFTGAADGTVFPDASGAAFYLRDGLGFSGNDALEILLGGVRCDVFGDIGHDPGTGWTGPGPESTRDQTLSLRGAVATGSSGWRQPGLRFVRAADGLEGFGTAPSLTDPYLTWAQQQGLSGLSLAPSEDPDGDGAANVLEYAMGGVPSDGRSRPGLVPAAGGALERVVRRNDPALVLQFEESDDLTTWRPASGGDTVVEVLPDGFERRRFVPAGTASRRWYRQRAARP